jgi:hypothetical protein
MLRPVLRHPSPRPDSAGEVVKSPFPWLIPASAILHRLDPARPASVRDLAFAERQRDARSLWAFNARLVGAANAGMRWFGEALVLDVAMQRQATAAMNRAGAAAEA